MADRQGVEIDYCPKCRGVWLDRGELDKLVERSALVDADLEVNEVPRQRHFDSEDDEHRYKGGERKRKSFLRNLFDFD